MTLGAVASAGLAALTALAAAAPAPPSPAPAPVVTTPAAPPVAAPAAPAAPATPAAPAAGTAVAAPLPVAITGPRTLDPKNLRSLTDDPVTAGAARVDGVEAKGVVAFTFDDGPSPVTTPAVIQALERYDVPATFFIVTRRLLGKLGATSRDVLAHELGDGFLVGSHSVSHPNLRSATSAILDREIDQSLRTLARQTQRPIGLFRPPYGALGRLGVARLRALNLTEVLWSVDTKDYLARSPERLRQKVVRMILKANGGVVLMHDVKKVTAAAIANILDDLEAENCRRVATGGEPIVPVSLHYFLRDGKHPREIPEAVLARTAAYRANLPARCARRAAPALPATGPATGPATDPMPPSEPPIAAPTP